MLTAARLQGRQGTEHRPARLGVGHHRAARVSAAVGVVTHRMDQCHAAATAARCRSGAQTEWGVHPCFQGRRGVEHRPARLGAEHRRVRAHMRARAWITTHEMVTKGHGPPVSLLRDRALLDCAAAAVRVGFGGLRASAARLQERQEAEDRPALRRARPQQAMPAAGGSHPVHPEGARPGLLREPG